MNMNYNKIYECLIEKRRKIPIIGYSENHHIIPKSLGGSNKKENLVRLTAREHYIAHLLLHKIHNCSSTAYAVWMMQMKCEERGIAQIKSSRMYEWARKEFCKYTSKCNSIRQKGKNNSQYGTMYICNLELKENKRIKKTDVVPVGWVRGRNKWNEIERKKQSILKQEQRTHQRKEEKLRRKEEKNKMKKIQKQIRKEQLKCDSLKKIEIVKKSNIDLTKYGWCSQVGKLLGMNKMSAHNLIRRYYDGPIYKKFD